jgi:ion channel
VRSASFAVERGQNNNTRGLGDAFWWAVATVTTRGLWDVSPTTAEGTIDCGCLMVLGIGIIGGVRRDDHYLFLGADRIVDKENSIEARVVRMEEKLDALRRERT